MKIFSVKDFDYHLTARVPSYAWFGLMSLIILVGSIVPFNPSFAFSNFLIKLFFLVFVWKGLFSFFKTSKRVY